MRQPSDHVLRTLAAVPVTNRILNLGCDAHTEPLIRLGFEVHACDPDLESVKATRAALAEKIDKSQLEQRLIHIARRDALGYPDAFFDWIVAYDVFGTDPSEASLLPVLAEARRVLKPGGWIAIALNVDKEGRGIDSESLQALLEKADFALSEQPAIAHEAGSDVVRGIFRRVDVGTPL